MRTGHDHTWFVLTQKIIEKEFALSGSEQNPDLTGQERPGRPRAGPGGRAGAGAGVHGPRRGLHRRAVDLADLVRRMNELTGEPLIDEAALRGEIVARDREIANPFTKDLQVTAMRGARKYLGDRLIRTAAPHRLLDPKAGPADRRTAATS